MTKAKLLLTILYFTISFVSCSDQAQTEETAETQKDSVINEIEVPATISEDVEAAKFKELIESGTGLLIDVRTPEEYSAGHIAGSINIDFNGADFGGAIDTLNKITPVYVYCQAGGRSGQAKDLMKEKGFSEVYNLIGGFGSWPY